MKTALIRRLDFSEFPDSEYYLVENQEDLDQYKEFTKRLAMKLIKSTTKSSMPIRKFDHMIPSKGHEKGIAMMALTRSQSNTVDINERGESIFNNPLYQLMPAALEKNEVLQRALDRGDVLLIGKKMGGWMTHSTERTEILRVFDSEMVPTRKESLIRHQTKWIVLENDNELPKDSESFLEEQDPGFSIVYDLRDAKLDELLERFKFIGGHTVFVYTTGMDVQQMYKYTDVIAKVGLNKLVFYFVSGLNPEIEEFLVYAKTKIANVKVLSRKELNA